MEGLKDYLRVVCKMLFYALIMVACLAAFVVTLWIGDQLWFDYGIGVAFFIDAVLFISFIVHKEQF